MPSGNRPEEEDDLPDAPDVDDVQENEVFCFLNRDCPCTGECAAYRTFPEESKNLEPHQQHCSLLIYAERGSRSLNIIAGLINEAVGRQRNAKADERRAQAFGESPKKESG